MKDGQPAAQQTPCPYCSGTGEISSFKGVSRFLLTREECPVCSGTGLDSSAWTQNQNATREGSSD